MNLGSELVHPVRRYWRAVGRAVVTQGDCDCDYDENGARHATLEDGGEVREHGRAGEPFFEPLGQKRSFENTSSRQNLICLLLI